MSKQGYAVLDMEHRVSGPAYRWKLAQKVASSERMGRLVQEDKQIQHAVSYLRVLQKSGYEPACRKYPAIASACRLVANELSFEVLKLCVLGKLPRTEVAARLNVEQQAIEACETLFFDIGHFDQAPSWMSCHVFIPEAKFGSKELAAKLKVAHHGGPVVTRALLDGMEKLPLDAAQQWVDQELLLHAKLQVALEVDLDAQSAQEFLKIFLEYDLGRKKLEFEREKFHHECALDRARQRDVQECESDEPVTEKAVSGQDISPGEQFHRNVVRPVDDEQLVA